MFVPKGVDVPVLDEKKLWAFRPDLKIKINSMLTGGDIIGYIPENNLFDEHRIMVPPKAKGKVTWIAPEGEYTIRDKIIELEFEGKKFEYTMAHQWPVR